MVVESFIGEGPAPQAGTAVLFELSLCFFSYCLGCRSPRFKGMAQVDCCYEIGVDCLLAGVGHFVVTLTSVTTL